MIIEFNDKEYPIFDEIIEILNAHSNFAYANLNDEPTLTFPGLEINPNRRTVYCNNIEVKLTPKEYEILYMLTLNKGRVLTYDQMYQKIWKEDAIGNEKNVICCHIHKIKVKFFAAHPNPRFCIKCVRNVGYCFDVKEK